MATRSVRTVTASGTSSGGGGYTHPACICQTIICSPCYKTNFNSSIDDTTCVKPTGGTDWVTIYSLCGDDASWSNATCLDLDFDYYNYDAVCFDISLGICCCCSSSQYLYLGTSGGYNHCCCYPYFFENLCQPHQYCCKQTLASSCCQCGFIHFNAMFYPSFWCQRNNLANAGCCYGIAGYKFNKGLGGANYSGDGFSGFFNIDPYSQPCGNYCMFWCTWDRLRIYNSCGICARTNVDRINITGRRYQSYDGS